MMLIIKNMCQKVEKCLKNVDFWIFYIYIYIIFFNNTLFVCFESEYNIKHYINYLTSNYDAKYQKYVSKS